jgi:hypothetical protein
MGDGHHLPDPGHPADVGPDGDVGGVVGAQSDHPAAAEPPGGHGAGGVVAVGVAGEGLDDRVGADDVGEDLLDTDALVLGHQPLGRVGQVVGGNQALGRGVAQVGHGLAGGTRQPGSGGGRRGRRGYPPARVRGAAGLAAVGRGVGREGGADGHGGGPAGRGRDRAAQAGAGREQHPGAGREGSQGNGPGGPGEPVPAQATPVLGQAFPADGLLDVAPGQGGDGDGGGDLDGGAGEVLGGVGRGGHHDDGIMPQVDPVGADPHPAQRGPAQGPAGPGAGGRHGGDDRRRGHRQHDYPAAVEERRVLAGAPDQHADHGQPGEPAGIEPGPGAPVGRGAPAGPDHGQRRADQDPGGPGVGALVGAGRIQPGVVQREHGHGRAGGQGQRGQRQPGQPAGLAFAQPPHAQQPAQQQPRPDQVELLLHGQRPQVIQRRGRREPGEVRLVLDDQVPVGRVGRGRDDRAAQPPQLGPVGDGHPRADHDQHHEQRRQQPPGPPQPEIGQRQPPGPGPLPQQQVGDQVPGQGEEHSYPQQAPGRPAQLLVEGDHRDHGQRAQPVQPRQVPLARPHRLRHRPPRGPPTAWASVPK